MAAASEDRMSIIHGLLADDMIELLENRKDKPLSASDRQAISKFLKDNDVTMQPNEDNKLGKIQQQLLAREEAKRTRALTDSEIEAALPESHMH